MNLRRVLLCAMLTTCLALVGSAWAGTIEFTGANVNGQGALSFTPGLGNTLTVGADGSGNPGALINQLLDTLGLCGASGCAVSGGYLTLTSGAQIASPGCSGGQCAYDFAGGGTIDIHGTVTTSLGTSSGLLLHAMFTNGAFDVTGTVGSFAGALNLSSIMLAHPAFGTYTFTGGSGDTVTISLNSGCSTGGACNGLVDQASVSLQTIPEPATLCIMGASLTFLGTGLKRKLVKA